MAFSAPLASAFNFSLWYLKSLLFSWIVGFQKIRVFELNRTFLTIFFYEKNVVKSLKLGFQFLNSDKPEDDF